MIEVNFSGGGEEGMIIDNGSTASSPDFVRQESRSVRLSSPRGITTRMDSSLREEFTVA
jgi:hypothetical protein